MHELMTTFTANNGFIGGDTATSNTATHLNEGKGKQKISGKKRGRENRYYEVSCY